MRVILNTSVDGTPPPYNLQSVLFFCAKAESDVVGMVIVAEW